MKSKSLNVSVAVEKVYVKALTLEIAKRSQE